MTERERWIVYPLLFLALGAALRDKLGGRTTTKSIVCQELRIEDEPIGNQPARVLAALGRAQNQAESPAYGYFYLNGKVEVDGVIQASQFVSGGAGGRPYQMLPGVSLPDFLRALQSGQGRMTHNPNEVQAPPNPPPAMQPRLQQKQESEASEAPAEKSSESSVSPK